MKDRNKPDRLQQALKKAYHLRDAVPVEQGWETQVMRQVRGLGPLNRGPGWVDFIEGYFWKFAPVVCALILVLSVALIFQFDFISDAEMAKTFFEGSAGLFLFSSVGKFLRTKQMAKTKFFAGLDPYLSAGRTCRGLWDGFLL